jgi:protein SCO1
MNPKVKASVRQPARRAGLTALAALAGTALLSACRRGGDSFRSTDLTGASYGKSLELVDHTGRPRTLEDFRGKVVVVFFGFTQCPDICPTTMLTFANARKRLGAKADDVQVLFVTLDPERDSPEVLAQYVPAFDPTFLGLRGDAEATARAAREFKVFYERVPGRQGGAYTVDHTAASYVIDRQGQLRLYVRHSQSVDDVEADLRRLLAA